MPITYEVKTITEPDLGKSRRFAFATIEKTMNLTGHLKPVVTTVKVSYPVNNGTHMCNLVDTLPPAKSFDNWERIDVAKVLKRFN